MKKSLFFIVLFFFVCLGVFGCNGGGGSNSGGDNNVSGGQDSGEKWRTTKIEFDDDNDGILDRIYTNTFNDQGNYLTCYNIVAENSCLEDPVGFDIVKVEYLYDSTNRLIKEANSLLASTGELLSYYETSYDYDSLGRVIKTTYENSIQVTEILYAYDDSNKLISRRDGEFGSIYLLSYDSNDKLSKIYIDSDGDSIIDEKEIYIYNSSGRLLENQYIESEIIDGAVVYFKSGVIKYEYNAEGLVTKEEFLGQTEYSYDSKGRLIREVTSDYGIEYFNYEEPDIVFNAYDSFGPNVDPWNKIVNTQTPFNSTYKAYLACKGELDLEGDGTIDTLVNSDISVTSTSVIDEAKFDINADGIFDRVMITTMELR